MIGWHGVGTGDGECDDVCNSQASGWDDGDCCRRTAAYWNANGEPTRTPDPESQPRKPDCPVALQSLLAAGDNGGGEQQASTTAC